MQSQNALQKAEEMQIVNMLPCWNHSLLKSINTWYLCLLCICHASYSMLTSNMLTSNFQMRKSYFVASTLFMQTLRHYRVII